MRKCNMKQQREILWEKKISVSHPTSSEYFGDKKQEGNFYNLRELMRELLSLQFLLW